MEPLPKTLADEIESLEELDARALKKKYRVMLSDATKCVSSPTLRAMVAPKKAPAKKPVAKKAKK